MELNDKTVKIKVEKLRKCFGDLEVLRDISTEIHEGEVVVILGPSGSGKSTFLRCLNKLETTTAGSIVIDGVNISEKKVNMNKVRENIGMVFQHFNLFNNMDVLHNLMLAPTELKKSRQKRSERAGNGYAEAGWSCRKGRCVSIPAFRRAEAASCNCARTVHETGYHAV